MNLAAAPRTLTTMRGAALLFVLATMFSPVRAGTVTYETDPATGRVTEAHFPDGTIVTYTYDGNGNRTRAAVVYATDTQPPTAPTNLATSGVTATSITLNWTESTDNRGVVGYRVERCQGSGCSSWSQIATPATSTYTDTGRTNGTWYSYRVLAVDAAALTSSWSNTASVQTVDNVAPSAPGTPTFSSITATSVIVSWTAATDNVGVTGYQYSRDAGNSWTNASTGVQITGLTTGNTYTVRVRARDAFGNWGDFSSNSFQTADTSAPSAPGVPSFTSITATSVVVSWTAASDNVGVTGYQYSTNGGSTWTTASSGVSISGLTNGTTYTVLVRARDAVGLWGTPSSNSFQTTDTTAPSAPGTPMFTNIAQTSVTVSWTAATDNVGVTGYQYSRDAGATWVNASSGVTITGLTGNTNYTVRVRAGDQVGLWGNFSSASFTTVALADTVAPSAPGTPSFSSITATSVIVSWAAATDNVGVTGYRYSRDAGASWTAAVSGVSITGLTNGTIYTVRVQARDAAGNWGNFSSDSFQTTDTTAPSAPGTPTFSGITATSVVVNWTAATDNVGVTGYQYSRDGGATWTTASSGVSITGLTNGTTYTVLVRARDLIGLWGNPSSNSFQTTDTTAPSAPGNPTFSSITGTSVVVNWSAATDNVGVTGYQYSRDAGSSWVDASSGVTISGLTNGTNYTVRVRARDQAGLWGNFSSNSFQTTDTTAPSTPGIPAITSITASSATATWSASTDNVGVAEYQYNLNATGWTTNGTSTSVGLTGLAQASQHAVAVRARDATNNWSTASQNSFNTPDVTAPSAPGALTFTSIGATSAVVSFAAATDNVGVQGYEYLLNGVGWNPITSGATLSGLATAMEYTVQVRAYDTSNIRGNPSVNSFTTIDNIPPGAPGVPTFGSIGATTVVATWSAANDNVGILRYEYSVNGGSWISVGNVTSATVSGLSPGASNTVQIHAVDTAGLAGSASSNSVMTFAQITIANRTVSTQMLGAPGVTASYQLRSTGDIFTSQPGPGLPIDNGDWITPKSGFSNYEVYATPVAGVTCGGPLNQWLNLGANPSGWGIGRGPPSGSITCAIDLQIRHVSNPSVILGTARITISASN